MKFRNFSSILPVLLSVHVQTSVSYVIKKHNTKWQSVKAFVGFLGRYFHSQPRVYEHTPKNAIPNPAISCNTFSAEATKYCVQRFQQTFWETLKSLRFVDR